MDHARQHTAAPPPIRVPWLASVGFACIDRVFAVICVRFRITEAVRSP